MSIPSLFQFIIGFFLGIIFFTAGIAGGAYFFLTNANNTNPEKHIFPEEKPSPAKTKPSTATKPEAKPQPEAVKPKPEPKPEPKSEEKLPDGAYYARVTWSTGLSLRAEPSTEAERVGGVGYNSKIIILSTSTDGRWQRIRIPSSGQEAWVKAGNVAKVEESDNE